MYKIVLEKKVDGGGVAGTNATRGNALELPNKPTVVVLPFANVSGEIEEEYFADGLTDDVITELSRFGSFFVIARNSSFHYKDRTPKIQELARELGVQYIVEGSVRRAGGRIRVTGQLVDALTGRHIWAERYDRELDDIFAVQDELVRSVAFAVSGNLDKVAKVRALTKPTESLTAYDVYMRAEWHLQRAWHNETVRGLYEKVIEIDPQFARAHAQLAGLHGYRVFTQGAERSEIIDQCRYHAERALEIDDHDAYTRCMVANAYLMMLDHDAAMHHVQRAVALNPNDAMVMGRVSLILSYLGEDDEAMGWHRLSLKLNPHFGDADRETHFDVNYMAHRYDDAIGSFRGWSHPPSHMYAELAAAYAQLDLMDKAQNAVECHIQSRPRQFDFARVASFHGDLCAQQKDRDHWLEGYRKAGLLP